MSTAARLLRETDDRFLVAPTVLAETYDLLHEFGGPHLRWRSCAASPPASSNWLC